MKNIIFLLSIFLMGTVYSQTYQDTICWVWVNGAQYNAVSGESFSSKAELNSILEANHVVYYEEALPFAETTELHKIHEIRCNRFGHIDNVINDLSSSFSGTFDRFSKFEVMDSVYVYDPIDWMWVAHADDWLWHLKRIQADYAWDITRGDPEIKIAVIDYDFDVTHPDLATEIVPHYDPYSLYQYDCIISSGSNFHGTVVASFASAETTEQGGTPQGQLASVGFNTKIIGYMSGSRQTNLAKALHACNVMGADVMVSCAGGSLNCSPDPNTGEELIVKEILDNGMSIVMPAGNGPNGISCGPAGNQHAFYPFNPEYDDRIIIVTGTDINDYHYYENALGEEKTHSHFPDVDICSPGHDLMGAKITECGAITWPYYGSNGGTSFASPIVAGVVSLLKSINEDFTPGEIQEFIKRTADPVTDGQNYQGLIGAGRINAFGAVYLAANCLPEVFNGTDIWTEDKIILCGLIIEEDAELTIHSTVKFSQRSKVIIKRGAKLILDEGILTSLDNNLWKGVEVWGTNNQPQTQQYQGIVEIINGGTIENAICGIQTVKMSLPEGEFEFPDYNYTGGIILCEDAIFKNNQTAVKFWNYNHSPSVSYFRECEFLTNDNLIEGTEVNCFIEMAGISGVHILGNSFTDNHSFTEPDELTTGIFASNSQFYVLPQAGQPNVFTGLYYGIKALATSPITTIQIENNQFTNNLRSVYLSATNNAHVNLNVFNPWTELLLDPSESYCMYLDHCTGYQVEQNTFTNEVGTHKGIGLIVNQSGSVNNMIYLNYFNNLLYGAIAQNENRNKAGTLGLQFKCNEFTENASDLSVTYLPPKTKSTGIAASQGSSLPNPSAPAGNLFSWTGPLGTPTDINNEAQHVTYYYHNTAPTYKLQPLYYSPLTVSPQGVSAPYNEESCPPNFEGGGGGGGGSRSTMLLAEQKADSLQAIISTLEDGGNTLELKEDVEWSLPPESMEVYNELMNNSPYLTDTVIGAAIEKEDVLANAMIRDVMVANPQSSKDDELLDKLEVRNNPVPDYMMGEILQGRSLVSVYEELQSKLSFYTQQRSAAYHSLVTSYLTDTINPISSIDSLAAIFSNEHTPEAKYSLAFLSMDQGAWSEGLDILDQVSTLFNLTDEQQAEQQYLVEFCTLMSALNSTLPDSIQLNELNEIESANTGIGSVYARNILLALDETEYNEPVILPGVLKSSEAVKYEQYLQSARDMKYLEVFPNPVQDHVIISWKLDNTSTDVKIKITDNTGSNISEISVNSYENQQVFDTHNLKPGVYIATLIVNGKQTDSAKFTLIK